MVRNEDTNFPLQFAPAHQISEYPAIPAFAAGTLPSGRKSRPFPARHLPFSDRHAPFRLAPRPSHSFSTRHIHSTHPVPAPPSVRHPLGRFGRTTFHPTAASTKSRRIVTQKKPTLPQRCCGRVGSYNAGSAVGESVILAARFSACTCGVRAIWRFLPAR